MYIPTCLLKLNCLNHNSTLLKQGIQKTKAVVSGKWTAKCPIDTKKVIEIVKNARNLDIEIEFEDK